MLGAKGPGLKGSVMGPLRASVQLCVRLGSGQGRLLELCQVGVLRCLGRPMTLASRGDCNWPAASASCGDCKPGTVCQGESSSLFFFCSTNKSWILIHFFPLSFSIESSGKCVCQNPSECPTDSAPLCVASDGVERTMTQCEFGARRCAGEQVEAIDIEACPQ